MTVCRNVVTTVAIVACCIVGTASVITNHDQLEISLSVIAALAGLTQIPRKTDIATPTTGAPVIPNGQ